MDGFYLFSGVLPEIFFLFSGVSLKTDQTVSRSCTHDGFFFFLIWCYTVINKWCQCIVFVTIYHLILSDDLFGVQVYYRKNFVELFFCVLCDWKISNACVAYLYSQSGFKEIHSIVIRIENVQMNFLRKQRKLKSVMLISYRNIF